MKTRSKRRNNTTDRKIETENNTKTMKNEIQNDYTFNMKNIEKNDLNRNNTDEDVENSIDHNTTGTYEAKINESGKSDGNKDMRVNGKNFINFFVIR